MISKPYNKPKIGIIGYFGHGNAGDEAMKDILLKEFDNSVANNKNEIEKCDAYIIAGGDLIQEFSGIHLPWLWESLRDEPRYAISLGAKAGWEKHEGFIKKELIKFRKIYTREQDSFDILSQITKIDGVMPDVVLLSDAEISQKKYPIIFNYTTRDWVDPDGQFEDIMNSGADIYPVAISRERDFDLRYSDNLLSWKEFISMAKASEGVIGTRLHAVVMGVVSGVPVSAIAYEGKVRKFCERYSVPCFEYGKKNGREVVDGMKKAEIDLDSERQKIKNVIEKIKEDLNNHFS